MFKKLLMVFTISISLALLFFACINSPVYAQTYALSYGNNQAVWMFYNELLPYGSWVNHSVYGWVWQPSGVNASWQPYTEGHWAFTDYGWTWVSDHSWGWAVFHYGRWFKDTYHGWLWYPGSEWGPAWVVWRYNDDLIGWAPLPPGITGSSEFDLDFTYTRFDDFIPAPNYTFVEIRYFTRVNIIRHIIIHRSRKDLFNRTRVHADYRHHYNGYRKNSLPVQERIERYSSRKIKPVRTREVNSPNAQSPVETDEITIVRPKFNAGQKDRGREYKFEKKEENNALIKSPERQSSQEKRISVPVVTRPSQINEQRNIKKDEIRSREDLTRQNEFTEKRLDEPFPSQPRRLIEQPRTILIPQIQKDENRVRIEGSHNRRNDPSSSHVTRRLEIKAAQEKTIKPKKADESGILRKEIRQNAKILEQKDAAKSMKFQDSKPSNTAKEEEKVFRGRRNRERDNFRKTDDLIRQPGASIGVGIHTP
ncbi:MAG: DUF6600 domain-containing protein [Candidatus Omnitrophota bacterium]